MLFIHYPKCSTCKKAKQFLDEHNIKYEEQDIKLNPPTYEELKSYYEKSNLPIKRFVNTSGLIYKELNLKDKLPTMTDDEILKLISTNGMLIKRPLLITDKDILTGYKEEDYKRTIDKLYFFSYSLRFIYLISKTFIPSKVTLNTAGALQCPSTIVSSS